MKNLQNLYWAESGDLVAIASDTSFYILKFNVRVSLNLKIFRNIFLHFHFRGFS